MVEGCRFGSVSQFQVVGVFGFLFSIDHELLFLFRFCFLTIKQTNKIQTLGTLFNVIKCRESVVSVDDGFPELFGIWID